MSTLDDIAKERQLIAERLAKLDGDRAKLAEQLAELEAAERVLSRFTQGTPRAGRRGRRAAAAATAAAAAPRRGRRAATAAAAAAAPRRGRRGRGAAPKAAAKTAAPRAAKRGAARAAPRATRAGGVSLGDATLRAVAMHGNGISAEDVRKYIADQLGMQVRPNHLGMALQRHRRAGRLEQRDLLWYSRHSAGADAAAS
jgi:DNA invertase Pin-like site-specific DNA recombinase